MMTIKWPPRRNEQGGLATLTEPGDITAQLVTLSMLPGRSANPWDVVDGAGSDDDTYEVAGSDDAYRSFVRRRMARLERDGVARLDGVIDISHETEGTRVVAFGYFDLRTRKPGRYTTGDE